MEQYRGMLKSVPYPSGEVETLSGNCVLPKEIGICLGDFDADAVTAFLERCGVDGNGGMFLTLAKNQTLPKEGYVLEIKESGIAVEAACEQGVIWALTTVANLLDHGKLPCCRIEDAPKYAHRGISLDCARHFFPAEEVKRIINTMSLAKLNVLHWHLADDQGWRIESKKFPRLQEVSKEYFTQDEIREVVRYAALRGVEVIPEIDLPGHTSGILAAYPEYSCSGQEVNLATCGGIYPVILCAGQEKTIPFLKELLEEIAGLFPGPRFHIGGDEAPKSEWKKCPHCQARMQELGITNYEDLQADFSRRVNDILKALGKQAICWNETLRANTPPEDIQVQYWTLQYRDSMEAFADTGGKWIYSDMFELYLDYPHSMTSLKKLYTTQPHLGKRSVTDKDGLIGLEGCLWAEHITERVRLENLLFPRAFALGEICWCGAKKYEAFLTRLEAQLASPLYGGIHITEENWWDPKGSARRKEAIGFFTAINSGMSDDVREQTVESAAPNREFAQSFMNKFFKPLDMPFLLAAMFKK